MEKLFEGICSLDEMDKWCRMEWCDWEDSRAKGRVVEAEREKEGKDEREGEERDRAQSLFMQSCTMFGYIRPSELKLQVSLKL